MRHLRLISPFLVFSPQNFRRLTFDAWSIGEKAPLVVRTNLKSTMTSTPPMITTSMTTPPLTPSSPSSTASLGEELSSLLERAKQASSDVYKGSRGDGPICLGWVTEDMFDQLSSDFSSAWRLSWGLTSSMNEALRQEDQGLVGQILFWGDPTPIHERTIEWLHTKVCQQLRG
jgi:hypothetical protein